MGLVSLPTVGCLIYQWIPGLFRIYYFARPKKYRQLSPIIPLFCLQPNWDPYHKSHQLGMVVSPSIHGFLGFSHQSSWWTWEFVIWTSCSTWSKPKFLLLLQDFFNFNSGLQDPTNCLVHFLDWGFQHFAQFGSRIGLEPVPCRSPFGTVSRCNFWFQWFTWKHKTLKTTAKLGQLSPCVQLISQNVVV